MTPTTPVIERLPRVLHLRVTGSMAGVAACHPHSQLLEFAEGVRPSIISCDSASRSQWRVTRRGSLWMCPRLNKRSLPHNEKFLRCEQSNASFFRAQRLSILSHTGIVITTRASSALRRFSVRSGPPRKNNRVPFPQKRFHSPKRSTKRSSCFPA